MDIVWDDEDGIADAVMALYDDGETDSDLETEQDVEEAFPQPRWGGSRIGKLGNIERHRVFYSHLLYNDYWGDSPVYSTAYFKKFFKLPISLFDEIVVKLVDHDDYFRQKKDAAGKIGLSSLQKICSAIRLLTSGVSSTEHDDKYRMAASTGLEALKRFCKGVNTLFSADALRHPTFGDVNRLLDEGRQAGFPGCIGSIDCMHWEWKNCPSAWKGMFQGKAGVPTVVLEAIADKSCRFWHFNFGAPGTLNDVNILDRSPLFDNAIRGEAPQVNFSVNGNDYAVAYWLGDGIYPTYACFVKTFPNPRTRMQKLFATAQEAKRKDIERAFGILQARFHILTTPCRLWERNAMKTVIKTCVILHNMIIDYEREHGEDSGYIAHEQYAPQHPFTVIPREIGQSAETRVGMINDMQCSDTHHRLQYDLMVEMFDKWQEQENGIESDDNSMLNIND